MCTRLQIGSNVRQQWQCLTVVTPGTRHTKTQQIYCCAAHFFKSFVYFLFLADFDTLLGGEVGGVEFGKLPFGACEEPIR